MNRISGFTAICAAIIILNGCAAFKPGTAPAAGMPGPAAEREFRGAWVATVGNIDWPSKPGLPVDQQQREIRAILDTAVVLNLNAIILQVRPHCDAMYPSQLEPWSYYLTGTEGKAPEPYYDPLAYWVEEAHQRGIELHAWFNPYRARTARGGDIAEVSVIRTKPHLVKRLPDGMYWLDPSRKETQDYSHNVVMDVVRRYDVDGVQFDDYFYPYGDGTFPDDDSWSDYQKSGGSLSREDWRRDAVNTFIERIYAGIKKEKPRVKFGLSPFGIWRPGNPPSIAGFDQFSVLYADAKLWLNKGWIDYWAPQLYWPIAQIPQSYPVLLNWWARENTEGRHLWPGMFTSRMTDERGAIETQNQIMVERGIVPEAPGHIHFSFRTFLRDSSLLNSALRNGTYRTQALVPPSPWLDDHVPAKPAAVVTSFQDTLQISWTHEHPEEVFRWVVYYQFGTTWSYIIVPQSTRSYRIPASRPVQARRGAQAPPAGTMEVCSRVIVSAVSRTGVESEKTTAVFPGAPHAAR